MSAKELVSLVQLSVHSVVEIEPVVLGGLVLPILIVVWLFYSVGRALLGRGSRTDVQKMTEDEQRLLRLPRLIGGD